MHAAKPEAGLDQSDCNCLALRQAARHVSQIYDAHLASSGLRTTQYSILMKLGRLGPLSINALAASMVMDRTTLGRAIRPLERDGLLMVGRGKDARERSLELTDAGAARLERAEAGWRSAQSEFETGFGTDEAEILRTMLRRTIESLHQRVAAGATDTE